MRTGIVGKVDHCNQGDTHPVYPFIGTILLKSIVEKNSPDVTKGLATLTEHTTSMVLKFLRTQLRP